MLSCFKKGLIRVFIYYVIGAAMILIFHFITGSENKYAPPFSIILLAILLVCGLPWLALNLLSIFKSSSRLQNLGEMTIHLIMYSISIALIALETGRL
jgi:hypothetical protein